MTNAVRATPLPLEAGALVLHTDNVRADAPGDRRVFRDNGRLAAGRLGTSPIPILSAQDILNALRSSPGNLRVVVMVGHGTPTSFFEPRSFGFRTGRTALPAWLSVQDFAAALAPKLARNAVVSIGGCSSGRNADEPAVWGVNSTSWDGGERSLAAQLRDALAARGAVAEVRAHTLLGTTLQNPQGRAFSTATPGAPGVHLMRVMGRARPTTHAEYRDWNNYAQGDVAFNWMMGA